jgi:hypothetical protein
MKPRIKITVWEFNCSICSGDFLSWSNSITSSADLPVIRMWLSSKQIAYSESDYLNKKKKLVYWDMLLTYSMAQGLLNYDAWAGSNYPLLLVCSQALLACMYCIVLYWRGSHCYPMHCDLFKIYCATPNLGITRTWICRLNFAQRPICSGLRFFNEPEISDSGSPA